MDDFIAVHNLLNQLLSLLLVHAPDFLNAGLISLLEALKLLLEILKDVSVILIVLGLSNIDLLVLSLLLKELLLLVSDGLHDLTLLLLEVVSSGLVDLLTLLEHSEVELELLVVQFEDGLHVFHALLEGLHLLFKLDLLVGLSVGVITSNLL